MMTASNGVGGVSKVFINELRIRPPPAPAETPPTDTAETPYDLSLPNGLLNVPLHFVIHADQGSYVIPLDYLRLVRSCQGIVRIPGLCCLALMRGQETPQIETVIEGRTKLRHLMRGDSSPILSSLVDALIAQHCRQLVFDVHSKPHKVERIEGFRQLLEKFQKKNSFLTKIEIKGPFAWLNGRIIAKQELGLLKNALKGFVNRGPTEKELLELACKHLFAHAIPDMRRFILLRTEALQALSPAVQLIPKSGQGEVLQDGYVIRCTDQLKRCHQVTIFAGFAPPAKAHFQTISLELNANDRFELQASHQAQTDVQDQMLRWIDVEGAPPGDWALHLVFRTKGMRGTADDEQHLKERMMAECQRSDSYGPSVARWLRQAIRDCEIHDSGDVAACVLNAILEMADEYSQELAVGWDLPAEDSLLRHAIQSFRLGAVRPEVLRSVLQLGLWCLPRSHLLQHGEGLRVQVEIDGHPLYTHFKPAEALRRLADCHPFRPDEERIVQLLSERQSLNEENQKLIISFLSDLRRAAEPLLNHSDPALRASARELFFFSATLEDASEALFSLLKALPDLLEGEKQVETRKQLVQAVRDRIQVHFNQRLALSQELDLSNSLNVIADGHALSRFEIIQLLSESLAAIGDVALSQVANAMRQQVPPDHLIKQLCRKEEDAAYVQALELFSDAALQNKLPVKRRAELQALLIATRLIILSNGKGQTLDPSALNEMKDFLSVPRPVELRRQCLRAAMQYLAGFFSQPDSTMQVFNIAWEHLYTLELECFQLTNQMLISREGLHSLNQWIRNFLKTPQMVQDHEISPGQFFTSFVGSFLLYLGDRYRTDTSVQKSVKMVVPLWQTQIENRFGPFRIMLDDSEDYAFALQVLLENCLKMKPEKIELQVCLLGVVYASLFAMIEKRPGSSLEQVFPLLDEYAFWTAATFPSLLMQHQFFIRSLLQCAEEKQMFRNQPRLRFQLHFLAGEPLKQAPQFSRSKFSAEVKAFLDKLQGGKGHTGMLKRFQVLLRLIREYGHEHPELHQQLNHFFESITEVGWERVRLIRQLCREAVNHWKARESAMLPVLTVLEPYLFEQWLAVLSENPPASPSEKLDVPSEVLVNLDLLIQVWTESCPSKVMDRFHAVIRMVLDIQQKQIEAIKITTDLEMSAVCKTYIRRYDQFARMPGSREIRIRLLEGWATLCSKVDGYLNAMEFANPQTGMMYLHQYIGLLECGSPLVEDDCKKFCSTFGKVFDTIVAKNLHPLVIGADMAQLFLSLITVESPSFTMRIALVEVVRGKMKALHGLHHDEIDNACVKLLSESESFQRLFREFPKELADLKSLFKSR